MCAAIGRLPGAAFRLTHQLVGFRPGIRYIPLPQASSGGCGFSVVTFLSSRPDCPSAKAVRHAVLMRCFDAILQRLTMPLIGAMFCILYFASTINTTASMLFFASVSISFLGETLHACILRSDCCYEQTCTERSYVSYICPSVSYKGGLRLNGAI